MSHDKVSNYLGERKAADVKKNTIAWLILAVFVIGIAFIPLIFPIKTGGAITVLLNNYRFTSGLISFAVFWLIGVMIGLVILVLKQKFED